MQVYKNVILKSKYQSSKLCEAVYTRCEDIMDQLQVLRLPSMAKFNAGFLQCNQSFEHECVGSSKTNYKQRMMKVRHNTKCFLVFYSTTCGFYSLLFLFHFCISLEHWNLQGFSSVHRNENFSYFICLSLPLLSMEMSRYSLNILN